MNLSGATGTPDLIEIQQPTDAAEARRMALGRAARLSFDESEAGRLGLIVTELAKNLLKHAGSGEVFLRTVEGGGVPFIEVLSVDKGPGIEDVSRSFQDGYSTAGTPGNGLGAIARLANVYDVYSRRGQGTVLLAQIWKSSAPVPSPGFRVGAVSRPVRGEVRCGDAWLAQDRSSGLRLMIADGLGHGPNAADAAETAVQTARENPLEEPSQLLERAHRAMRATRGAAAAIADIDLDSPLIHFAGVGNISGVVIPPSSPWRRMVSHSGIVGHELRRTSEFTYPWAPGCLVVLHSDGLTTSWSFDNYPGVSTRHPSVIAGLLYRDFTRGRDDVTVVVAAGRDGVE